MFERKFQEKSAQQQKLKNNIECTSDLDKRSELRQKCKTLLKEIYHLVQVEKDDQLKQLIEQFKNSKNDSKMF